VPDGGISSTDCDHSLPFLYIDFDSQIPTLPRPIIAPRTLRIEESDALVAPD
jgi:hypothetical protein